MVVICGLYLSLMSWYSWQVVKKCSLVATSCCAVGAQSFFSGEPGVPVASALLSKAVLTDSAHGQGFSYFWIGQRVR